MTVVYTVELEEVFDSIDDALAGLRAQQYLVGRELATSVFLAGKLGKPLLVEGEGGVGKSELARALADARGTSLIRLQCHIGMTETGAVYEWDRAKQLLSILRTVHEDSATQQRTVFQEANLIRGPLLEALTCDGPEAPVLLIDRLDLVDNAFEAFLIEYLDSYSVAIPGVGTIAARPAPTVVLTSNGTRDISDGLKRACLYVVIGYPSFDAELELLTSSVPGMTRALAGQVCNVVARLRRETFARRPGIGEALDWARALVALRATALDVRTMDQTLGCLFKSAEDIKRCRRAGLGRLIAPAIDRAG
jgi:MoxR-like ATPase